MKEEIIIDLKKLSIYSVIVKLLTSVILLILSFNVKSIVSLSIKWHMLVYIVFIFLIHEVLHRIGFKIIAGAPIKNIKIGFNKKLVAPYCSFKGLIMTKKQYVWVMLLPNIILSLLTLVIMINSNNLFWTLIMGYVIGSCTIDYYMAIRALKQPIGARFEGHPSELGCYVLY